MNRPGAGADGVIEAAIAVCLSAQPEGEKRITERII